MGCFGSKYRSRRGIGSSRTTSTSTTAPLSRSMSNSSVIKRAIGSPQATSTPKMALLSRSMSYESSAIKKAIGSPQATSTPKAASLSRSMSYDSSAIKKAIGSPQATSTPKTALTSRSSSHESSNTREETESTQTTSTPNSSSTSSSTNHESSNNTREETGSTQTTSTPNSASTSSSTNHESSNNRREEIGSAQTTSTPKSASTSQDTSHESSKKTYTGPQSSKKPQDKTAFHSQGLSEPGETSNRGFCEGTSVDLPPSGISSQKSEKNDEVESSQSIRRETVVETPPPSGKVEPSSIKMIRKEAQDKKRNEWSQLVSRKKTSTVPRSSKKRQYESPLHSQGLPKLGETSNRQLERSFELAPSRISTQKFLRNDAVKSCQSGRRSLTTAELQAALRTVEPNSMFRKAQDITKSLTQLHDTCKVGNDLFRRPFDDDDDRNFGGLSVCY